MHIDAGVTNEKNSWPSMNFDLRIGLGFLLMNFFLMFPLMLYAIISTICEIGRDWDLFASVLIQKKIFSISKNYGTGLFELILV